MRIAKDSKLGVALAVLRKVVIKPSDVSVNMYSNCREQGFLVISFHKNLRNEVLNHRMVSFAEHRSSDNIVVQFGYQKDFDDYGVISEEKYETNRMFFSYDNPHGAGEFISKWLKGLI